MKVTKKRASAAPAPVVLKRGMHYIVESDPARAPHKTTALPVKVADVDVGIVPLFEWLNSFEHIQTRHSCQGEEGDNIDRPYIVFYCEDVLSLARVVSFLRHEADVQVDWYESAGMLRYTARFHSTDHLKRCIASLKAIAARKAA